VLGPRELPKILTTLVVGSIVAAVGFAAGLLYGLSPLLYGKEPSNLWPLFAIFVTGPAGFIVGSLGGFVWSKCSRAQ